MRKKIALVFLLVLSLALILTAVGCTAEKNKDSGAKTETGKQTADTPQDTKLLDDPVDQSSIDLNGDNAEKYKKSIEPVPGKNLFESYYEIADEEQRAKLDEIQGKYPGSTVNDHEREMMIIMGDLPEDMPRLTREEAVEICASVDVKDFDSPDAFEEYVVGLFNEVAGAPDLNSGSGVTHRMYYTDDSETDLIDVCCGVWYYDPVTDTQEALLSMADPSDD